MKGTREIKRRLKSVNNIKKITKAMEMVAATKLRRLQERALKTAPFAQKIEEMLRRVAVHVDQDASPLLIRPEEVTDEAVVIISADRGLCGSYNSNLFRRGSEHLRSLVKEGVQPHLTIFGKRGASFFGRTGAAQDFVYEGPFEKVNTHDVHAVVSMLCKSFLAGEVQRVRIVHTEMKSLASFSPRVVDLLPIPRIAADADSGEDYILDPSPEIILEALLPKFLEMRLYSSILDSLASEFAARRMAMKNATDNADDMIGALTREYNKARQAGITGELLDIAGGLFALDG